MNLHLMLRGLGMAALLMLLTPAWAGPAQQLEGIDAELGTPYKIGDSMQWQFTLDSAEFTIAPVNVGEFTTEAGKDEKILRLNFTVQNPSSDRTQLFNHTAFVFTAVDAQNTNHEDNNLWGHAETAESLSIQMKPAQKVSAYALIVTDAKGEVPKLIVEPKSGGKVLRYNLKGKVKGFAPPIADPADATGATALPLITMANMTDPATLRSLDFAITKVVMNATPAANSTPKEGLQFLRVEFTITNLAMRPLRHSHSRFESAIVSGGKRYKQFPVLFDAATNEAVTDFFEPGVTGEYALCYAVPVTLDAPRLEIAQATAGHCYSFPLTF